MRDLTVHRAVERDRRVRHAEPAQDLHLPSDDARPKSRRARARSSSALATQAFRGPVSADDLEACWRSTRRAASAATSKTAFASRCRRFSPARASCSASRRRRRRPAPARATGSATQDLASRLSFFLWGTVPDAELLKVASQGGAADAGGPREAGRADAGRSPRRGAGDALCARSGCGCRISTRSSPTTCSIRTTTTRWRGASGARPSCSSTACVREDRSLLDLIDADYSFVNERVALHYGIPNVTGSRVPPGDVCRQPPRHPRPRQHPGADVDLRSHLAGAARQVGHGGAARHAAAAAAAQRAGARRRQATGRAAARCRCASAWKSTARIRRAIPATG